MDYILLWLNTEKGISIVGRIILDRDDYDVKDLRLLATSWNVGAWCGVEWGDLSHEAHCPSSLPYPPSSLSSEEESQRSSRRLPWASRREGSFDVGRGNEKTVLLFLVLGDSSALSPPSLHSAMCFFTTVWRAKRTD